MNFPEKHGEWTVYWKQSYDYDKRANCTGTRMTTFEHVKKIASVTHMKRVGGDVLYLFKEKTDETDN